MSIVITVVTPYAIVQASDMQVTAFGDGTVLSHQQRKSMVLRGQRVVALVGWMGLATIGGHNTGAWLHGQLGAMRAAELPLETVAKTLADSATLHFATLPQVDKRCTFAMGGLFVTPVNTIEPFFCRVTNCEIGVAAALSSKASVSFETGFSLISPQKRSKHPYILTVSGDEQTASELPLHWRGLRGLLQRHADVNRISNACVQTARAVATKQDEKKSKNPAYVKTVGKNVLLVAINAVGTTIHSLFYPEDGSTAQVLAADVVSADLSTRHVTIENKVNTDGNTEIRVKGWFKIDRLPGENEPPLPLMTFLSKS